MPSFFCTSREDVEFDGFSLHEYIVDNLPPRVPRLKVESSEDRRMNCGTRLLGTVHLLYSK